MVPNIPPIMQNQMEKNMENEMENGIILTRERSSFSDLVRLEPFLGKYSYKRAPGLLEVITLVPDVLRTPGYVSITIMRIPMPRMH